ncbi:MAG: hypothetical protein Q8K93_11705 [Reyranella sp.]|uniref:hypothetical protein n=1 Tax=Reyranella sp. TaxID=1929291 RepID=UPI002730250A|nr:hypothetical protein [Reyranella sp.]MDP1962852.1 hypothetical protein [Reyranella sp.]MDP2378520.1 hypothetical protein [Reyranella sp.]
MGQLAQRATMEVDDASVADRIAGLNQDAATSWQNPAYLRRLGRTTVEELRYQGERRGWDPAETDTRVRSGLSDLYAGAVEAAIGQDDLDGASGLYDHARVVIDPERQAALDRRFVRAREDAILRDVDRALTAPPLDPRRPPDAETIADRAADLTPEDASEPVRARIGQVAEAAYRRLDRQWNKQRSEAGVAALEWLQQEPYTPIALLPQDVRDWLAPDQWSALEALKIEGYLKTDGDLFERLDRLLVYEPDRFTALDLDRHRLSLNDADHARFTGAQKAIAEGRLDPDHVRYNWLRRGVDRALKAQGVDTDGPAAVRVRADARDQLESFETIQGRTPVGADLDDIARRAVENVVAHRGITPQVEPPPGSLEGLDASSATSVPADEMPAPPDAPEVTRFDDGTRLVTRPAVETERGKADVSEAYDERDRIVSVTATFVDGHRVESRWSYQGKTHWSQIDTVRSPEGEALGTVTTTYDGDRVTRVAEPADGPPQTEIWDKDGPVATAQNVAAPVLVVPFLLELTAAAIGAVIVDKAIRDTIGRSGVGNADESGTSEMARPPADPPRQGHNNPPEPVDNDRPPSRPPSGPPVPPFLPGQRPGWRQSELDDAKDLAPNFEPQVAFKNGREVSSTTRESKRPDGVSKDRRSESFETKNYDINTNSDGLVGRVVEQVLERAQHLPPGMQQNIRIDVRGQQVSEEQLNEVAKRIVERSNGLLRREHIRFREKD